MSSGWLCLTSLWVPVPSVYSFSGEEGFPARRPLGAIYLHHSVSLWFCSSGLCYSAMVPFVGRVSGGQFCIVCGALIQWREANAWSKRSRLLGTVGFSCAEITSFPWMSRFGPPFLIREDRAISWAQLQQSILSKVRYLMKGEAPVQVSVRVCVCVCVCVCCGGWWVGIYR